jgi:hypothetical protein
MTSRYFLRFLNRRLAHRTTCDEPGLDFEQSFEEKLTTLRYAFLEFLDDEEIDMACHFIGEPHKKRVKHFILKCHDKKV